MTMYEDLEEVRKKWQDFSNRLHRLEARETTNRIEARLKRIEMQLFPRPPMDEDND